MMIGDVLKKNDYILFCYFYNNKKNNEILFFSITSMEIEKNTK